MLLEIVLLVLLLFGLIYRWITKSFSKWQKLGIPQIEPSFPFGSHNIIFGEKHLNEFGLDDYNKFSDEKLFGWFLFGKPTLSIQDPEIIKNIQVKDFNHFVDRNETNFSEVFGKGGKTDKLWALQLANAAGDHWKDIRSTFTPIFTSGKMKGMLKFIKAISEGLTTELGNKAKTGHEFELKGVYGKFSLDALASCAFGVDAESFTNENSKFVTYAARIFINTVMDNILTFSKFIPGVPQFMEIFNINVFKPKESMFFRNIILQAMNHRKQTKERKNDLIDLMLDCVEEQSKVDENEDQDQYEKDMKFVHDKKHKEIDEETIVATAMIFLVAGYDTTGMTLSYLSYAMAKNPEVQAKLQEEVDQAFENAGGKFPDYNTIIGLPYLDMVIHETLRVYNPVGLNTRSCTQDYTIPGTDITVKKGDLLSWSVAGLHTDPKYWKNPTEFYPEHFSKEEKAERHPYVFQAFGQGPRACIGMRFALLEAKVAVLSVFHRFTFQEGTKTLEPLTLDPENQLSWVKGGLWAKVVERE